MRFDQSKEAANLPRLRVAAKGLQVEAEAKDRVEIDVVASANPVQLEAEPFDQVTEVVEADVRLRDQHTS
jgi:hypothetical protein